MARPKRKPAKPEGAAPAEPRPEKAQDGNADLIATARKRWDRAENRDRENKLAAYDDLAFLAGEQWDAAAKAQRADRPCLTINRLPQFVEQVTGEIRQMRPAMKCVPVDERGDPDTAEVIAGLHRYIESRSQASKAIYPQAADSQVPAGIGHWQVTTEYADDSTFNQELRIAGIDDQLAVRWDPDANDPSRRDAMFCFVPVDMSADLFRETYPDASVASWESKDRLNFADWLTDDHVRVAVYWYKKPIKRLLALMPDGSIEDLTDRDPDEVAEARARAARVEWRPGHRVCRAVISATEVLEGPIDWPGRHIPVVPVIGREVRIGRKIVRYGLVRFAKDPQRLFNYAESAKAETIGQQPKAPWLVTDENIADYEEEWNRANQDNLPYLRYTPDTKNGNAPPQRINPPVSSPAIADMVRSSAENLHAVTGIYPAALGAKSNETSGKAIRARDEQSDTGTFVFKANFGLAIERTAEIVNDLIPHIYDTERTIRIIGDDGKVDLVKINQPAGLAEMGEDGQDAISKVLHDVTVGAYDVVVDMGPSYATKQAEAREGMTALIQAAPELAPTIGDLYAKAQDWPLADKIGKRLRALLPPAVQQMEAEEEGEPKPAPAAAPPDPLAERAAALEEAKLALEELKLQVEALKANADLEKAHLDAQGRALAATKPPEAAAQPAPEKAAGEAPDGALAAIAERVDALTAAIAEIDGVLEQVVTALAPPAAPAAPEPEIAIDPALLPVDGAAIAVPGQA